MGLDGKVGFKVAVTKLDHHSHGHPQAIRDILLREWDPIGIIDQPDAQDEYDDYSHEVHGMLIRHEPRDQLINHLWWVEKVSRGTDGKLVINDGSHEQPAWRNTCRGSW